MVAIDHGPASEQALTLARELLAGKRVEVTLLHVIPRHLIYGKGGPVVAECYDPAEEQARSRALLDASAQQLQSSGMGSPITKEIAAGDPADLILAAAEADGTDLIIVGSRGLNAAQRLLYGSVSGKVTTHAQCAVLVAHPKEEPTPSKVVRGRQLATA